jgi:hypothetical protein
MPVTVSLEVPYADTEQHFLFSPFRRLCGLFEA